MKLRRLKLENFRQHQNSEVVFRDGMTAIVGENGSGKSTILEAISFALYGEQRAKKESIRFLWAEKKSARVTLEFERGGKIYEVMRSETDARLTILGEKPEIIASKLEPTKARCIRELGLTYEHFKNSFCAEQKDLSFLNFKNAAAREIEVAKMLGFEVLQDASKLAVGRRDELRVSLTVQSQNLADETQLQTDLVEATRDVAAREKEIRLNTESQTKLQVRVPEAEVAEAKAQRYLEVVQRQQGLGEKAGILKENRAKTQLAVETAEKRVIERGELEPKALRFEALIGILKEHDRLRGLDESRLKLQGQLTASLEEEKGLQKDLGGIELPDHAAALAAVQRALVAFREAEQGHYTQREAWSGEQKARTGEQAKLTHERKALETKLRENQSLIAAGKCPKCGQPTTESLGDLLRDIQQEIEQALARESEFDAATKVIDARQAESLREFELRVEQARKDHGEAQTREQFAKEQAARAKSKQEDLTRKQQQIQKLQEQLAVPSAYSAAQHGLDRQEADGLREAHARFQAVKTAPKELADAKLALEAAEKEFAAAQKEFNDLKAERATLPFEDVTKAQLAIDDHTKLKVELGTLKGTLEGLTRSLTDVKRRLTAAQKAVADHAERKQKIEETKGQVNLNDATSKLLNQCRTSLNDQTKPELELRASLNLQHLTSGRYSNLKLDKDWGAILIDEDEKQKDVISGGEEDIVALALRLALSELIQERQGYPLSLLILDEVFGSLDAARRGAVLDRLVFLKDRFQQILVISHIEGINELADQCIFVVRDPQTKASRVSETGFDRPTDLLSLASEGDSLDF